MISGAGGFLHLFCLKSGNNPMRAHVSYGNLVTLQAMCARGYIRNTVTVLLAGLLLQSCLERSSLFWNDNAVARVGKVILSKEDVRNAVPEGVTGQDSAFFASSFVDKWMITQLKLQEAERMFSSSSEDIDGMVEEYRRSLLVRKLEQSYLNSEPSEEPDSASMVEYYDSHKSEFRLESSMVKGVVVELSDRFPRRLTLEKMMDYKTSGGKRDFEAFCAKNNIRYRAFDEWVTFEEFLSNIPVVRNQKHDDLLQSRKVQKIHQNSTLCLFRIVNVLNASDAMPFDMVRDKIQRILENRRQSDVIRQYEQNAMDRALENGEAKRYVNNEE